MGGTEEHSYTNENVLHLGFSQIVTFSSTCQSFPSNKKTHDISCNSQKVYPVYLQREIKHIKKMFLSL